MRTAIRKLTLTCWTVLLLAGGLGAHADDYGAPHPDAPPELLQFGFLIGPWNCDMDWLQTDGTRAQGQGTWTGRWMMDGWAIQDDYRDGFYEGFRATTFTPQCFPSQIQAHSQGNNTEVTDQLGSEQSTQGATHDAGGKHGARSCQVAKQG